MPSFFKIENKNSQNNELVNSLKEYSQKTGRNVILYASNFLSNEDDEVYIDTFDKNGFMEIIENLNHSKGLDLILHTSGGSCKNTIDWTEEILDNTLKYSNCKDIDKVKSALLNGEFTKNHSQNLSAKKCKEIGLNIKNFDDDEILNKLILSIHKSYLNYFNNYNICKLFVNQNGKILSTFSKK